MGGGAWPFLVGGVICLVNSVNERDLTYILKESHRGLGTGFAEFLRGEIGQLIFKRAYLMPGRRYFIMRPMQLKEDSI